MDEQKKNFPMINIQAMEDGTLNVSGSINDKILAYGLLHSAMDAINEHHKRLEMKQAQQNRIKIFKP